MKRFVALIGVPIELPDDFDAEAYIAQQEAEDAEEIEEDEDDPVMEAILTALENRPGQEIVFRFDGLEEDVEDEDEDEDEE